MTVIGAVADSSQNVIQETTLGKDDFFKMLLAQVQNQDPLNPMEGTDFATQLAQFSSLERLGDINAQLETLNLYQASVNNAQSLNLIGREVVAIGDVIKVEGESTDLTYSLSEDAKEVSIKIYDEAGDPVNTLEFGNQKEGRNSVTWDCNGVSEGKYTFDVSAVDDNGEEVNVDTMITGVVTGVAFKNGSSYLSINGEDIAFGNVISVNGLEG
ncbi:MAG: flagellar hook capping protein [Deltaproteobacteria bacterium]|nr:flagellar hook capping protein [Deltaproteobacteria bacterium]